MFAIDRLIEWQSNEQDKLRFIITSHWIYGGNTINVVLHDEKGTVTENSTGSEFDFAIYKALLRWGVGDFDKN